MVGQCGIGYGRRFGLYRKGKHNSVARGRIRILIPVCLRSLVTIKTACMFSVVIYVTIFGN